MVLNKNVKFGHNFIFRKIRQRNVCWQYFRNKKCFQDYKNEKLKNWKIGIFRKGLVHGFDQKCEIMPRFYFLQNKPKKCVWQYFRNKSCFQDYKNEKLKKSKNWDISKGLVHGFGQKCEIWPCFYFSQNKPKHVFDNILKTKKMLSRQKKPEV